MADTIESTFVDKSTWGDGPWQTEPDQIRWVDEATGLTCLVFRGPLGQVNGYVAVPEGHPLHGKDYDSPDVEVHGGLTYAGDSVPGKGEVEAIPGAYWFGFDTAHLWDLVPAMARGGGGHSPDDRYRDVGYVRNEVLSLAAQLAEQAS